MKKLLIVFLSIISIAGYTQVPTVFPFQGYLIDNSQEPIINRNVDLNILITDDPQGIEINYSESHSVQTDGNGLFNLEIGRGANSIGEFNMIDWLKTQAFVGIEYNLNDGQGFQLMGYEFLHAVPFALHAKYIISCVDGITGQNGVQGEQGPQGFQGAAGINGTNGLDGAPGPSGLPGLPIMAIESTPPTDPDNGTIYLDDGTNREDNLPGFRYYNLTDWIDL